MATKTYNSGKIDSLVGVLNSVINELTKIEDSNEKAYSELKSARLLLYTACRHLEDASYWESTTK